MSSSTTAARALLHAVDQLAALPGGPGVPARCDLISLGEVRRDHDRRLDDRAARAVGGVAFGARRSTSRGARTPARAPRVRAGVPSPFRDSSPESCRGSTSDSPTGTPFTRMRYCVGLQLHAVAHVHRRHDEAELRGDLPADHRDAIEEIAALRRVDERDEPVADLDLERIHDKQARPPVRVRDGASRSASMRRRRFARFRRRSCERASDQPSAAGAAPPSARNGTVGRPGTSPSEASIPAATSTARGFRKTWLHDVRCPGRSPPRGARHQDAGRGRDDERRNLRDEAVADRERACRCAAPRAIVMPRWATPMTKPPTMLITVMTMPAIASPRTNFEAPSIAP